MASELQVDELKGVTADGNITITSEGGSATMQLQQGIVKAWAEFSNNVVFADSLNFSSGTDNGTGDYNVVFTNNMSSANYAISSIASSTATRISTVDTEATNGYVVNGWAVNTNRNDITPLTIVIGDLA